MDKSPEVTQHGGVYNSGTINTAGGDIIGRDKFISTLSTAALDDAFDPVVEALRSVPIEARPNAQAMLESLKKEVAKGDQANDGVTARLIDGLVGLAPRAAGAVVKAFATPVLAGIAGPTSLFVLDKLRGA